MSATALRPLGAHGGPFCTAQGLGAASFGDRFELLPNEEALAAVDMAWRKGLRFFDTAPWYGKGLAEHRLGMGLHGRPRGEFVLQTKVGRYLRPARSDEEAASPAPWGGVGAGPFAIEFDYSFDAVLEQHQHSLQRLGTHRVDSLVIHDIEGSAGAGPGFVESGKTVDEHLDVLFDPARGGFRALQQLRSAGTIAAFGAGVNGGAEDATARAWNRAYCHRLADATSSGERPIDFFLLAEGFTLLNHWCVG
jgi:D-threo-aldose 1-dehydrogenase